VGTSLPATGFTLGDRSTTRLDRVRAYRSRATCEEAGGSAGRSGILLNEGSMARACLCDKGSRVQLCQTGAEMIERPPWPVSGECIEDAAVDDQVAPIPEPAPRPR